MLSFWYGSLFFSGQETEAISAKLSQVDLRASGLFRVCGRFEARKSNVMIYGPQRFCHVYVKALDKKVQSTQYVTAKKCMAELQSAELG